MSEGTPKVLVIDIGGSNVKFQLSGETKRHKFKSGKRMGPAEFVRKLKDATRGWHYDAASIGFPAPVLNGKIACEPQNLGKGWVGFNFRSALRKPVKVINDAAMQALGSYEGGRMLFLGLGTGLGSALVIDGEVVPLELAELRYTKGKTIEQVLGDAARERMGNRRWESLVWETVSTLQRAFIADYVMIGGGNAKLLKKLPEGARLGYNRQAFSGGQSLWL